MFPNRQKKSRPKAAFLCLRRGVSDFVSPDSQLFTLFSAYAEVFLTAFEGGKELEGFSLPTQRCFLPCPLPGGGQALFSAYAEVFLRTFRITGLPDAFLCLRRGVSEVIDLSTDRSLLFSAYAEVFLSKRRAGRGKAPFLCLRRGVSSMPALPRRSGSFSLPTQRCFSRCSSSRRAEKLFSAYAEVFLPGS